MTWRNPPSVEAGLNEATRRWPSRKKSSDGTIGDAAHAARKSDHNPDANGVVHAFDLTHDPANGVDCNVLSAHLIQSRDRRVEYIIWDKRICNSGAWTWKPYMGANPHTKHMHVSIKHSTAAEYDTSAWWELGEAASTAPVASSAGDPNTYPGTPIQQGSHGHHVRTVQQRLKNRGWNIVVDGFFGAKTLKVLLMFQWQNHLLPDGIVGAETWKAL